MKVLYVILAAVFLAGCGSNNQSKSEQQGDSQEVPSMASLKKVQPTTELDIKKRKLMELGMSYLNKAEVPQAIKTFGEVIKLDPTDTQAYFILVQTYIRLQNYPNAIEVLNSIIKIDPQNGQAYYLKGLVSGLAGDRQEAIKATEKSVQLFQEKRDEENFKRALVLLQGLSEEGASTIDQNSMKQNMINDKEISTNDKASKNEMSDVGSDR